MHEQIIAANLISEANKQGNVKAVSIIVGDLAHLPAEDLEKALANLVDWKINLTKEKANVKCECGYEGEPKILQRLHDNTIFECPKCAKTPKITSGDQIKLTEVIIK